jgi:transcriptional regulator with XRE-family HTH domain
MALGPPSTNGQLHGHALRNLHLREKSLRRAEAAPPLARLLVTIRAKELGITRLEFSRRSGISRGTLRDLELGVHAPTRRLLQRLLAFYKRSKVKSEMLDEVRRLYTGQRGTLTELIAWLEVQTGSARELARRVGISPSTLWEYRRGRFPLPLSLFRKICKAGGEEPAAAEPLWHSAERDRLLKRGYPEPLAEFWALCHRSNLAEKDLPALGVGTAALRKLRYLELPPWEQVARAAKNLCRDEVELENLRAVWQRGEREQLNRPADPFGARVQKLRLQAAIDRRELADLFGIGGKKPAQSVKHIEEGGAYSAHAYPAGLAAVLTTDRVERTELVNLWQSRRARFLQRHRPETWVELRLRREAFGFAIRDMEPILGYSPLEFQRIERGVVRLSETAQARVLSALEKAGEQRVTDLLARRQAEQNRLAGWRAPASVIEMIGLLVEREGGLVPLTRTLRRAGVMGIWPGRLKAMAAGGEVPPWPVLEKIGQACGVADLSNARDDWQMQYRKRLEAAGLAPLGVEVRLLIGEAASSARALSPRLRVSYPVLTRDLQRMDRGKPVRWQAIERILTAAKADPSGSAWERIEAWWLSTSRRR